MARYLGDWLKGDFEIKNGEVRPKRSYHYTINNEEFELEDRWIWIQTFSSRENQDMIIRAIPTITHPGCLSLAERHKDLVKLNTFKYEIHRWPWTNDDLHGYMTVVNADNMTADGEVHRSNLNKTMMPFAATMLRKRACDRLILLCLGLYQAGYYSSEEFGGDSAEPETYVSANTLNPEELESIKLRKIIKEVRLLFAAISSMNSDFNPKVFTNTLLASDKSSDQLTYEEWVIVKNAAEKEKTRLEEMV